MTDDRIVTLRLAPLLLLTACASAPTEPVASAAPQATAQTATPDAPALVAAEAADTAPLPYTPAAIRDYCVPGTIVKLALRQGTADPTYMAFHFTGGDAEWAEFDEVYSDHDGAEQGRGSQRATWRDLQGHAAFPVDSTTITDASCDTPAGRWDCWKYDVDKGSVVEHYWFAKEKPGPPVRMEVVSNGAVVLSMELVELRHGS